SSCNHTVTVPFTRLLRNSLEPCSCIDIGSTLRLAANYIHFPIQATISPSPFTIIPRGARVLTPAGHSTVEGSLDGDLLEISAPETTQNFPFFNFGTLGYPGGPSRYLKVPTSHKCPTSVQGLLKKAARSQRGARWKTLLIQ
ncbi:hypothetical protein CpipJ_CPIJ012318, partial [Culex quinquefasciatus]